MRHAAPRFARLRGWRSGASVERSPNGQAVELGDLRWDPGAHLFALLLAVCVELGTRWIGLLFMRQHPDLRGVHPSFFRGFRLDESLAERCSAPLLVSPPAEWFSDEPRLLLVGQETLGWGVGEGRGGESAISRLPDFLAARDGVDRLMCGYEKFGLGELPGQ